MRPHRPRIRPLPISRSSTSRHRHCVGTPIDDAGYADVSHVARAIDQAAAAITAGATCVIRSTLPVGSAARLASRPGVTPERLFVAPEFLRQGSALEDIRRPTQVVIGTLGEYMRPSYGFVGATGPG